jgi:hypothetical protein
LAFDQAIKDVASVVKTATTFHSGRRKYTTRQPTARRFAPNAAAANQRWRRSL